ncbi:hypothetical protein V3C99_001431, partial [Haemonchus contortus]
CILNFVTQRNTVISVSHLRNSYRGRPSFMPSSTPRKRLPSHRVDYINKR